MTDEQPAPVILFRKIEYADLPAVIEIDRVSFSMPWPPQSFEFELKNNPVARLWLAEAVQEDGSRQVCGMIVVWLVIDEAHIGTIAVLPGYRRQGIATRLLKFSLTRLQHEGARSVYLEVRHSNIEAQRLYDRFGFKLSGVRKNYYSDNNEDALLFTLDHLEQKSFY